MSGRSERMRSPCRTQHVCPSRPRAAVVGSLNRGEGGGGVWGPGVRGALFGVWRAGGGLRWAREVGEVFAGRGAE